MNQKPSDDPEFVKDDPSADQEERLSELKPEAEEAEEAEEKAQDEAQDEEAEMVSEEDNVMEEEHQDPSDIKESSDEVVG